MTLAELAVKLTLNSAEFISGFSAAGAGSKKFRAEVSESIEGIGNVLGGAISRFGEFGEVIGSTIERASGAAANAVIAFGRFGGVVGTVAGVGAGAAAAILALDAGAIGLAIHTAESAAKLGELSQRAGVSTEVLAGLGVAGRGVGVDTETMTGALEKLNANIVKAAIAPVGTKTAFSRLGVQVRDTAGNIRDTGAIFLDVVGKLANLQQPEEGFFVKQMFGKGGAAVIPLINLGVDKIAEKMKEAKAFGLGDPAAVAASQKFKETIAEIQDAFEGAALRLTKDLLPALQFFADKLQQAFESGQLQAFADKLAEIVKQTLLLGYELVHLGDLKIGGDALAGFLELKEGGAIEVEKARLRSLQLQRAIGGSSPGLDGEIKKSEESVRVASEKLAHDVNAALGGITWDKYKKDVEDFKKGMQPKLPFPTTFGDFSYLHESAKAKKSVLTDLTPQKEDTTFERIQERIKALQQEAADWAKVGGAGTQAEALIQEALKKGNEEFHRISIDASHDKTGRSTPFVLKNEDLIKTDAAESVFGAMNKALTAEFDKQREKFQEQGIAIRQLGDAYEQGGAAIASAALDKQFAEQNSKLNVLREALPLAVTQWGDASPVVEGLKNKIADLNAQLGGNKSSLSQNLSDELTSSLKGQSRAQADAKPFVEQLNNAFLQSETAVRGARIELELYNFVQKELEKGVVVTQSQINKQRQILTEADREAYDGALKQEAARFDLTEQYDIEINKLERIKEIMQESGRTTLLVEAQIFDEQNRLQHQWDEAILKVGTFGDRFRAVMSEVVIQGREAGAAIAQNFLNAIDGIETNLAKLLTGQKTNFKGVLQGLAEANTKALIQEGVGKIASHIPGVGTFLKGFVKRDGSSPESALYVQPVGGGLGGGYSLPSGANIPIFGSGNAGGLAAAFGNLDSTGGSTFFEQIGNFFKGFGGFKAGGGDMSPGRWYIAGEKGAEIVSGPGSVTPMSKLSGGHTMVVNNYFNSGNSQETDMFKRTGPQLHRHMSMAFSRLQNA